MKRRSIIVIVVAMLLAIGAVAPVAAAGPNFPARFDLPDGWAPEGITAGLGNTVFVGSLADGAIWKGDVRTGRGRILVPGAAGKVAVGVEYEARANRLWVVGGSTGEVRVYNASTGRLLKTYSFTSRGGGVGFLNDLVVTRSAVYVTDSGVKQLDVIPIGRNGRLVSPARARALPLSGDIAWVTGPGQFNANGIVARNGWLILVQSNAGKLFRVNPRTGVTRNIDLGGGSASDGDGLELNGGTLYVVRNTNKVSVFRLGSRLLSAEFLVDLSAPSLDVPTTAALQAGRLWVVNARFGTAMTPTTDYWITRLPIIR
ncbi:MAG: superoxide dismutase [Chloroflexota bacterium]|nr:superoxide dismutase [Chloroflexota bacterium]